MQEFINRPRNNPKRNNGESSKKSGTNIGLSSSTPHSEGCSKVKKNHISGKRGNCLLHGPNTNDTNNCKMLSAKAERTNQTYADQDKTQDQQKNVPSPPPSTTTLGRIQTRTTNYSRKARLALPHLSIRLRMQIKGRWKLK